MQGTTASACPPRGVHQTDDHFAQALKILWWFIIFCPYNGDMGAKRLYGDMET